MFSPERTKDAEGNQEHHQGGAIAHGIHDLQLQQVLVLQREACVSPTRPPGCLCSVLPQSVPASGCVNPFNSDCHVVHISRAPIHRLTTPWLWRRSWGSPDSNSNLYPSYLTLNLKAVLEYLQGQGAHCLPMNKEVIWYTAVKNIRYFFLI